MTYYINVNNDNLKDFLNIINSLKNIGVINSYDSIGKLGIEGEPISNDALLSILELSKKEIELGKSYSSDEVKQIVKNWKKHK